MARGEELTDQPWALRELLPPELPRRADGRGRPWRGQREVLNGVLWILRSGARWKDLPAHFPPSQTCHRRYQTWVRSGALRAVLETLAEDLRAAGRIDLSECYVDGTFIVAKKGGQPWVPPSGPRARSSWQWQTLPVFLSPSTQPSARPAEVTLVQATLAARFLAAQPERLIGDKAYDSDPLEAQLAAQNIEMIAPHRRGRKKARTQDGRALRRYRRRWKVERLFAWLQNERRILTRHERKAENYLGFVHLGCIKILLRRCL